MFSIAIQNSNRRLNIGKVFIAWILIFFPLILFEPHSLTYPPAATTNLTTPLSGNQINLPRMLLLLGIHGNCLVRNLLTERTGAHRRLSNTEEHASTLVTEACEQGWLLSFEQHENFVASHTNVCVSSYGTKSTVMCPFAGYQNRAQSPSISCPGRMCDLDIEHAPINKVIKKLGDQHWKPLISEILLILQQSCWQSWIQGFLPSKNETK